MFVFVFFSSRDRSLIHIFFFILSFLCTPILARSLARSHSRTLCPCVLCPVSVVLIARVFRSSPQKRSHPLHSPSTINNPINNAHTTEHTRCDSVVAHRVGRFALSLSIGELQLLNEFNYDLCIHGPHTSPSHTHTITYMSLSLFVVRVVLRCNVVDERGHAYASRLPGDDATYTEQYCHVT